MSRLIIHCLQKTILLVGELVNHAHGILCIIDDVPRHGRSDESGAAGDDDTVHDSCFDIKDINRSQSFL